MQPTDSKQQAELDKIDEKYYEALWRARDEYMNVLTPQQRQAQREASKTAFQEGKRGRELQDAANNLAGFSEELQAKLKKARAEVDALTSLMRGEVEAIMTEGQLKQLEEKNKIAAMKNQVQRAQAPATSHTAAKVPKISPNKKSKK